MRRLLSGNACNIESDSGFAPLLHRLVWKYLLRMVSQRCVTSHSTALAHGMPSLYQILKFLIEKGGDVNKGYSDFGRCINTVLFLAATTYQAYNVVQRSDIEAVLSLLLEAGSDPNSLDKWGLSPSDYILKRKNKMLLDLWSVILKKKGYVLGYIVTSAYGPYLIVSEGDETLTEASRALRTGDTTLSEANAVLLESVEMLFDYNKKLPVTGLSLIGWLGMKEDLLSRGKYRDSYKYRLSRRLHIRI